MRNVSCFIVALFISMAAQAAPKEKPPVLRPMARANTGDFKVEKGLVDKIYEASVEPEAQKERNYGNNEVSPQIGFLLPSRMEVKNSYFGVRYSDQISAIPIAHLSVAVPLVNVGMFRVFGLGRAGFSYVQGVYKAQTRETDIEARDTLTLQWIPLMLGSKAEYRISSLPSVRPAIHVGGGTQYFSQAGSLDGIDQTFWSPYVMSGASLTLFDKSEIGDNVFGGFTIGGFYQSSLSSAQTIRGWSLELGTRVVM